jgi:plasmid stabilization system protein ParE
VKPKAVIPRKRAEQDVDEAIDYYLREDAPEAALGFIDALEQAYSYIGRQPDGGSSRYTGELNLPDLRFWRLKNIRTWFSTWSGAITSMSGAFSTACATFLLGCKILI